MFPVAGTVSIIARGLVVEDTHTQVVVVVMVVVVVVLVVVVVVRSNASNDVGADISATAVEEMHVS